MGPPPGRMGGCVCACAGTYVCAGAWCTYPGVRVFYVRGHVRVV
jgi:hypothetical protein